MAQGYRLVVEAPRTATAAAKTFDFGPGSGVVLSIDLAMKLDKRLLATLSVVLHDPGWELLSALPDPAFERVPVKLYLSSPGNIQSPPVLVFEGDLDSIHAGFPGPTRLSLVAQDRSVRARRQSKARTFKNLTSIQLAEKIATEYGFTLSLAAGLPVLVARASHVQASPPKGYFSDWDLVQRALSSDGLEAYMTGDTVKVRQKADKAYPVTFTRGQPPVMSLDVQINHVGVPGGGGDTTTLAFQDRDTAKVRGVSGAQATEAGRQSAENQTDLAPVSSPAADTAASHHEDRNVTARQRQAPSRRRRKDSLTITCTALPDLTPDHTITLSGWGGKVDGDWFPESIAHRILGAVATTTIQGKRGISGGAVRQSALPAVAA